MDTKRNPLIGAIAGILLLSVAGCNHSMIVGPLVGTVVGYEPKAVVAKKGPGAILVESEGQTRTLFSLYNDATILVFSDQPCLGANSDVVRSASWVGRDVAIIEVAGPADNGGAHEQCALARGDTVGNLISLCDPAGLLRQLYRVQTPTAVLVLDEDGFVQTSGALTDFEYYRLLAQNVALRAERNRRELLHGDSRL
jgi:hypothetical protein